MSKGWGSDFWGDPLCGGQQKEIVRVRKRRRREEEKEGRRWGGKKSRTFA